MIKELKQLVGNKLSISTENGAILTCDKKHAVVGFIVLCGCMLDIDTSNCVVYTYINKEENKYNWYDCVEITVDYKELYSDYNNDESNLLVRFYVPVKELCDFVVEYMYCGGKHGRDK